jgi:hypothetical protein
MRIATCLVCVVALAACSTKQKSPTDMTVDEAVAALSPAVNARLERIAGLADQISKVDRSKRYEAPLEQMARSALDNKLGGNTVVVYAADLKALDHPEKARVDARIPLSHDVTGCWSALKRRMYGAFDARGGGFWKDYEPIKGFQVTLMCEMIPLAEKLVIIDFAYAGAKTDLADLSRDESPDQPKTFEAGAASGWLLVWDLTTGNYEGARPFAAKSSDTVDYAVRVNQQGKVVDRLAHQTAVSHDLDDHVIRAIELALAGRPATP